VNIDNLTTRQREMIVKMWSINSVTELNAWQQSLTQEEFKLSIALQDLMIAEYIDEVTEGDDNLYDAQFVIVKIKQNSKK
jgi:hypothetical protein